MTACVFSPRKLISFPGSSIVIPWCLLRITGWYPERVSEWPRSFSSRCILKRSWFWAFEEFPISSDPTVISQSQCSRFLISTAMWVENHTGSAVWLQVQASSWVFCSPRDFFLPSSSPPPPPVHPSFLPPQHVTHFYSISFVFFCVFSHHCLLRTSNCIVKALAGLG